MLMAIGLGLLVWCVLSVVLSFGVARYLARGTVPLHRVTPMRARELAGSAARHG